LPFAICHLPFAICHLPFAIRPLPPCANLNCPLYFVGGGYTSFWAAVPVIHFHRIENRAIVARFLAITISETTTTPCDSPMTTKHPKPAGRLNRFNDLFQDIVLDEPYRLRLRRHYRMFREKLARRNTRNP
jgi:hypothetical protein